MKINWNFLRGREGNKKTFCGGSMDIVFVELHIGNSWRGGGGLKSQLNLLEEKHETKIKLEFLGGFTRGCKKKNPSGWGMDIFWNYTSLTKLSPDSTKLICGGIYEQWIIG